MSEEKLTRAAVVTGGSRGIGRAVCVALAKLGCNVAVNYCHGEAAAAETAALCKELGVEAVTVQADVSTAEGCKKLNPDARHPRPHLPKHHKPPPHPPPTSRVRSSAARRPHAGWCASAMAASST